MTRKPRTYIWTEGTQIVDMTKNAAKKYGEMDKLENAANLLEMLPANSSDALFERLTQVVRKFQHMKDFDLMDHMRNEIARQTTNYKNEIDEQINEMEFPTTTHCHKNGSKESRRTKRPPDRVVRAAKNQAPSEKPDTVKSVVTRTLRVTQTVSC